MHTSQVSELQRAPFSEWCWYFDDTKEQYRLAGNMTVIGKDAGDTDQQEVAYTISHLFP